MHKSLKKKKKKKKSVDNFETEHKTCISLVRGAVPPNQSTKHANLWLGIQYPLKSRTASTTRELYPSQTIFNHRNRDQLLEFRTSFFLWDNKAVSSLSKGISSTLNISESIDTVETRTPNLTHRRRPRAVSIALSWLLLDRICFLDTLTRFNYFKDLPC